jgi:hypothetical protein
MNASPNQNHPTVDEIVATLARSSEPTLLVEGRQDMYALRKVEDLVAGSSIMPCGDKDAVLALLKRRSEFSNVPCAFLVDSDFWFYYGIPEKYQRSLYLITTSGFSIENDILFQSRIFDFYDDRDMVKYNRILDELNRWWAFVLLKREQGVEIPISHHIRSIVGDLARPCLKEEFISDASNPYVEPSSERLRRSREDLEMGIRGHQYAELHKFILVEKGNSHKTLAGGLYAMAGILGDSPHLERVVNSIKEVFRKQGLSV